MNERMVMVPDIGEKVSCTVYSRRNEYEKILYKGTVVYVHPELRFFTLEFGSHPYTYRESYIIGR